jgi:hypothetical protein
MWFEEGTNEHQDVMERLLPLKLMQLKKADLSKQFVIKPDSGNYISREIVFKFYENTNCKILYLTGNYSVASIADLLSELPPVKCNVRNVKEKWCIKIHLNRYENFCGRRYSRTNI